MIRRGDVILIDFPFSDLTTRKRRPAVVLADAGRGDWVLCQVTSNAQADPSAIRLDAADFSSGGLSHVSFVRPLKLVTANRRVFHRRMGRLTPAARSRLLRAVSAGFKP